MTLFTTDAALAVVLGAAFGLGVCFILSLAPRWGAPTLARRIAPYIRDVTDPRGLTPASGIPVTDLRGLSRAGIDRAARAMGGSESVERRLRQTGRTTDAASFRARQLAWAVFGVAVGGGVVVVLVLLGRGSGGLAILPPVAAFAAASLYDFALTRAAAARVGRIEEELPTVLEFLALCLSAGENILDSVRRVSEVGAGELTGELRGVVVAVGTGSSLSESLARLSARLEIPALARAVDQLVAALDRGAPLVHVLHSQALDAREDAKRRLIERAGRKEIFMLVPLVFLILPLSVLFAVFPGIFMLRLGIG
ncbi:type II secretion system F family protein [Microbacterium sp. 4R-513]|uniref:type II secretion system F family protein n=1 Tax=Microbacterium sp. 4R-513 TaxID=2567934 RepID=UPI0013E1281C|nr:type II secretion system F family protein [Microbacterium sp. 4R-513]QIG40346.1 type II secretion system F family protein [Microbacterium sp. 4R-513]